MIHWLKKVFARKPTREELEALESRWYDDISAKMSAVLGKEHEMVLHAIIPFAVGGALDLYYYAKGLPGTAIATKELSHAVEASSTNDKFDKYELVMFTQESMNLDNAHDEETSFGRAHQNIARILNPIANYSQQARLNPFETCEFPEEMERVGGKCLIFQDYGSTSSSEKEPFGLMAVIEIFPSEMEYAKKNGGQKLISLLQEKGHYPYSDLDRDPVA